MQLDNTGALEEFRVADGLDVWVVPDFAQSVLGFDPAAVQAALEANYATKGAGDAIEAGTVQWVNGDNAALKYRGNELKRGKIWLQRLASADGYLRYGYTGWQWRVLPATADVARCPEVLPIADAYDEWAAGLGFPHANHYIVTKYRDGQHNIGFHSDKPKDIAPGSLITVVKTGTHGRPFELCYPGEESAPFYSQVLAPGTAVIMTLEANLKTKHGVPVVAEAGASGSIVFRTIATKLTLETVVKELGKRKCLTVATDADPPRHTAPEVDPSTICDGGGVTEEGVGEEAKRTRKEVLELEKQEAKRARKAGAILAPSRTAEGYPLPTGNQKTCKPDALFNGLKTFGFDAPSLARLRSLSIPKLGLDPMASWASIASTLTSLDYPFSIEEATWRFKGEGGPLLNLLRAPPGVFLVSLLVIVDGVRNKHCVILSTLKEKHAPFGKLIDNHGKMVPTYLEKKDLRGKEMAKAAWKLFIGQNPAVHGPSFSVEPVDVYALVKKCVSAILPATR